MAESWLTYLLGNADPNATDEEGFPFANSRLFQYFGDGHTLLSKNQPSPLGPNGIYGPGIYGPGIGRRPTTGGGSGGSGGGTSPPPPPPPAPPPVNPGMAPWAFPQYTQTWAFTPPTPFVNPPVPVFNKANYPVTDPTAKKK